MVKKIIEIEVNEDLGRMLIEARDAIGVQQQDIAALCGVSRQCLGEWERGLRTPTVENCERLAEALKLDLKKLLEITHPDILKLAKKLGKG